MTIEERTKEGSVELTLEQFLELRRPAGLAVSSDGRRIAFSVTAAFARKGERPESHIWTGAIEGGCEQATRGAGTDIAPCWSSSRRLWPPCSSSVPASHSEACGMQRT